MKLSEKERKVLGAVRLMADQPVATIAKLAGMKPHAFRYIAASLVDRGILSKRVALNPFKIGCFVFGFWFALSPTSRKQREALFQFLLSTPQVRYLGEWGGQYEIKIDIVVWNPFELNRFLVQLLSSFGKIIEKRTLTFQTGFHEFPLKIFLSKGHWRKSHTRRIESTVTKTDELDVRILNAVSGLGELAIAPLARKMKLPASTLSYRLAGLKKEKVLVGEFYNIDYEKVGLTQYVHLVSVRGATNSIQDRVLEFCREHQRVIVLVELQGAWDFEINTVSLSSGDEMAFRREFLDKFGDMVGEIISQPCFRHHRSEDFPTKNQLKE